jgi:hypothetical protein
MSDEKTDGRDDALNLRAGRGPAYPGISLEDAIDRASKFKLANAIRITLNLEAAYRVLGFKGASGASRQIIASLNYYGLLDYIGKGTDRKVRLSELALRILLDKMPDSPERTAALKEAALKPAIHAKLAEEFKLPPPSDIVLERFLVLECEYSEGVAETIIKVYRDTLQYAGLNNPDRIDDEEGIVVDPAPPATMVDDAMKGIGAGIGKSTVTPAIHQQALTPPPVDPGAMKVALDGDRIIVSAVVDLKDAKKLLKRLQANIDLLEAERGDNASASQPVTREAQVSLMITQAQKEALRAKGFEDDQIAHMTPEKAHQLLGILPPPPY